MSELIGLTHRDCKKCGAVKPFSAFIKQQGCKYGYRSRCRDCDKEYRKTESGIASIEKSKGREEYIASQADYRKTNARKMALAKYSQTQAFKDTQKRWRAAHPMKARAIVNARRRRVRDATPKWANKKYIKLFYDIAQLETARLGEVVEVDHIVPLRGKNVCGLHVEHNLQFMFKPDNSRKGNRL